MSTTESILFLDDCLRRCRRFKSQFPAAEIVHTVAECIAAMQRQAWDEVELDHDLDEQTYCDSDSPDCGMEVVRWVLLNSPDVRTFVVHTCNEIAGPIMVKALESAGYRVVYAPFRFV